MEWTQGTGSFEVIDDSGRRHRLRQFTVFETGRVVGGAPTPKRVYFRLDDGTELEALAGDQQFVDRRGRAYRKA